MDRRELAAALNVNPQTVTKWTAAGAPVAKRGRKGKPHLYDQEAIEAWLKAREDAASNGNGQVDLTAERARKERWDARLKEQKYLERARELLPAEEVAEVWSTHIGAVRTKLLAFPSHLADRVFRAAKQGGLAAVEQVLEAGVREILTEIADGTLEEDEEAGELCGALTSSGTPCRNKAKENGRCHIPSHQP